MTGIFPATFYFCQLVQLFLIIDGRKSWKIFEFERNWGKLDNGGDGGGGEEVVDKNLSLFIENWILFTQKYKKKPKKVSTNKASTN